MPNARRVLVGVTYGFSVRYLVPTGVLAQLADVCRPVVGLGWDDPELVRELEGLGIETVRMPDARIDHEHRMFRRRMAILHERRLRSPSSAIERRQRVALLKGRGRAIHDLRRLRDSLQLAVPGAAAATEAEEPAKVRAGTNVAEFESFLASSGVDAVLCLTPYHDQDALLLFAARSMGIPSLTSVISFDNPTTRARMVVRSERVLVWNRFNRAELLRSYPDLTEDRIGVIGAPQFDLHRRADLVATEKDWRTELGLPADRPIVLYGGGPSFLVPQETRLVELLDDAIDRGAIAGDPYLLVRRHPAERPEPWDALRSRLRHGTVVDPWAAGSNPHRGWPTEDDLRVQMSSLQHSAVHVNVCSSMTLDGAVFDRPQVGPTFVPGLDRAEQRRVRDLYEREHWWPITRSGGLRTADDEEQLVAAVAASLDDPSIGREGRRRMAQDLLTYTDGAAGTRLVKEVADLVGERSVSGSQRVQR